MKILDTKWFCGRTNVGIVRVQFEDGDTRYYIASVEGYDETDDAQFIADYGSYFPDDAGDILFGVK